MGIFSKKDPCFPDPRPTRLNEEWFTAWARNVAGRVGPQSVSASKTWLNEADAVIWLWEKSIGVIDHDFRDYVTRYCSPAALRRYVAFCNSTQLTPWGLISITATLQPERLSDWEVFLVDDMEQKLNRFAEIVINPSSVQ